TTRAPWTCAAVAKRGPPVESWRRSALQRSVTSPTGSRPAVEKLPAARVVVNARTPKLAKSSIASAATDGAGAVIGSADILAATVAGLVAPVLDPLDSGAERVQALFDPLVAAL